VIAASLAQKSQVEVVYCDAGLHEREDNPTPLRLQDHSRAPLREAGQRRRVDDNAFTIGWG
jgi:hypothetical protein